MPTTVVATMAEAELLDNVIELAHLFGWRVAHFRPAMTKHGWRTPVSADGKGFVDLVLVRDRTIFVELKSTKGRSQAASWPPELSRSSSLPRVSCRRPCVVITGSMTSGGAEQLAGRAPVRPGDDALTSRPWRR
jgi:hypothetical protein